MTVFIILWIACVGSVLLFMVGAVTFNTESAKERRARKKRDRMEAIKAEEDFRMKAEEAAAKAE